MKRRRVLVTGPTESLEEYVRAAERAGWDAIEYPLLDVRPQRLDPAMLARGFDWIAVTSSSALHALDEACARVPALRSIPCAVVGTRTAERARALGFEIALAPAEDAAHLARLLLARAQASDRVLWPRGDRTDELARVLRAGGLDVTDLVAYTNQPRARAEQPPATEAVFFASASAVRAWHARARGGGASESRLAPRESPRARAGESDSPPDASDRGLAADCDSARGRAADCDSASTVAIAIGATTFEALLAETRAEFFDIISLPEASPEAFELVLAHLHAGPAP